MQFSIQYGLLEDMLNYFHDLPVTLRSLLIKSTHVAVTMNVNELIVSQEFKRLKTKCKHGVIDGVEGNGFFLTTPETEEK